MDGVFGFCLRTSTVDALADAQQLRVEQLFLSLGVHLEKCGKPFPDSVQCPSVGGIDLLEDGKEPSLLMVVIKDELGDIHGPPIAAGRETIVSHLAQPKNSPDWREQTIALPWS